MEPAPAYTLLGHAVDQEADIENVQFFRQQMIFEFSGEGHNPVKGQRTDNV